jgi:putative transposase
VLAAAFRIEVPRAASGAADGTVSLAGQRFEIPSRYRHLAVVHLRYARWDLTRVDLVDPHTGAVLCPITPLDKSANADGQRRRPTVTGDGRSVAATAFGHGAAAAPVARRLRRHRLAAGVSAASPADQDLA